MPTLLLTVCYSEAKTVYHKHQRVVIFWPHDEKREIRAGFTQIKPTLTQINYDIQILNKVY